MVDRERSRSELDRAAIRLDTAKKFGPIGRAGVVDQPGLWAR